MAAHSSWFDVDKEGLAKLLERKPKAFVVYELLQNSWDTDATQVEVTLAPIPNKPFCKLRVVDNSSRGFSNLAHAFTLYAESEKKADPEKRGRFNLGEKLILALCTKACITTMSGTILFDEEGRHRSVRRSDYGSILDFTIRMTRTEYDEVCAAVKRVIVPEGKQTTFNGEILQTKKRIDVPGAPSGFMMTLPTEVADQDGYLKRTTRSTFVGLHEVGKDEKPMLYEMGIPVVELDGGEPWHIDIQQKVPLNSERDNVTPAYLRDLRTAMLNMTHLLLKGPEAASRDWVRQAAGTKGVSIWAAEHVKTERFGEKAVSYDPTDPEGSKIAAHQGYTVIPGGALSKDEWARLKEFELVKPAGQVTPSTPEGFAKTSWIDEKDRTPGMRALARLVEKLGAVLIDRKVNVFFVQSPEASTLAQWSQGKMTFNVSTLGRRFFERGVTQKQVDLILHELGHHFAGDHLSKEYNDALTHLGAKLAFFMAENPTLFKDYGW